MKSKGPKEYRDNDTNTLSKKYPIHEEYAEKFQMFSPERKQECNKNTHVWINSGCQFLVVQPVVCALQVNYLLETDHRLAK